jgi:glyoxylase-like metal-dependent hydrolase (beta-lactamase superfamily II)
MSADTAETFRVADGVHGIDIELFDAGGTAVYLFDDDEPALVDAGTAASADTIVAGLRQHGVDPADLEHLLLSHVHIDHSGAAADLVEHNPDLDVYIHEMTAPHLADPEALLESSAEAMGEHFELMGDQGPVPEANIVGVGDEGLTIDTGAYTLEMIHAPGHSPDHFAVWNPEREVLFAAECLGMYLEETDTWVPPATLPNFDVELLGEAIDQLRPLDPETIVFPHFGVWPYDPSEAFETAERELHRFDERILDLYEEAGSVEATVEAVRRELVDVSPPYDEDVAGFYGNMTTRGYLKYHGIE